MEIWTASRWREAGAGRGCRLVTADGVGALKLCTLSAVHYSRGQSPTDSKNAEWTVGNVARCYCHMSEVGHTAIGEFTRDIPGGIRPMSNLSGTFYGGGRR